MGTKGTSETAPADGDDVVAETGHDPAGVTEESDTADEPNDLNETSGPKKSRPRWWRRATTAIARHWIRGTAAVVFVAVLAGAGYEGWLLFQHHQRKVAAHHALDAAQEFAVNFTNADPDTIDEAITAITEGTTGEFKDRYVRSISQLRAMLIENKVTTHGTVVRSAIESVTGDQVQVLLFVKESFTSAAVPESPPESSPASPTGSSPESPEPSTDVVGMEITLDNVDGRWLVSKVVPGNKL